eukprot:TRINITY_DN10791_c0_g2_i3.p3 TRINITY_DN10791_c0_g2~~TRINITY_DN10791_c0_g2_i3.p3  ORF type:complete len:217 (-),score=23.55 TRINITY_DN10791_c0_g2_i3:303-953(-)
MSNVKARILVGVTGSVATIKIQELVQELKLWAEVKVVATESSKHFFSASDLDKVEVYGDDSDWHGWQKKGDPVLHIELRRWADAFIIAPLSANSLAKMACGMCDNLLLCVYRAWDFQKPLIVALAMNTLMYESPFTKKHKNTLQQLGISFVPTVNKKLACGDVGLGAMALPKDIANFACQKLFTKQKKKFIVRKHYFVCVVLVLGIVKSLIDRRKL